MKTILVTGSSGQLGQELHELSADFLNYNFIFASRELLDISNKTSVDNFFAENKIDFCLNCAAYTAVDKAQDDRESCWKINSGGVENLAKACNTHNSVLIHISSDYVFDGTKTAPYLETDATNPINYYGQTKLEGENFALKNNPKTFVIRTSWVYSKKYGKNFYKTILRLAAEKEEIQIVSDQTGCPTDAKDLAKILLKIVEKVNSEKNFKDFGIYNYSGSQIQSWFDFAKKIVSENKLSCTILPIPSNNYPTPAKRPAYSVLSCKKIDKLFSI